MPTLTPYVLQRTVASYAFALVILTTCSLLAAFAKDSVSAPDGISALTARYKSIKNFHNEWTVSHPSNLIYTEPADTVFYYMDCVPASDVIGLDDISDELTALIDLAGFAISVTSGMKVNKYPEAVWGPLLSKFENERTNSFARMRHVKSTDSPEGTPERIFLTKLSQEINRYTLKHRLNNPEMWWSYMCGTGFRSDIYFKGNPPANRIEIIPVFWYMYCEREGVDPLDRDKCKFWRDTNEGKKELVGGEYYLRAYWTEDIKPTLRHLDISSMDDGDTLTISKP